MDDATFNQQLKEVFYQGRPCSYHYTKSLAEHLIGEQVARGYVPAYAAHLRPDSAYSSDAEDSAAGVGVLKSRKAFVSASAAAAANEDDDRPNCEVLEDCEEEVENKKGRNAEKARATFGRASSGEGVHSHHSTGNNWRPFPAAIIRPSIITCAWKEPFPGWIDNYNGTTGFMVVSGKGVLRTIHANPDYVTDVVPVDVVINACISAAWYIAACRPKAALGVISTLTESAEPEVEVEAASSGQGSSRRTSSSSSGLSSCAGSGSEGGGGGVFTDKKGTGQEVFVVNCVSGWWNFPFFYLLDINFKTLFILLLLPYLGSTNAITWAQLRDISTPLLMKYPSSELFRVPGVRYHRYEALHKLNLYLEHTIPAVVTDFMFRFLGHTPV